MRTRLIVAAIAVGLAGVSAARSETAGYFNLSSSEKARIVADEKALLDGLCAYRDFLCLPDRKS